MASDTPTKRLVAYFPSWGIHAAKYTVADVPADRLTHLVYAFASVSPDAKCVSAAPADDSVNPEGSDPEAILQL